MPKGPQLKSIVVRTFPMVLLRKRNQGTTLNATRYERRDQLTAERGALLNSLEGIKSLFIATFADELPERWRLATRAWLETRQERQPYDLDAVNGKDAEPLRIEARRMAHSFLEKKGIWGHQLSEASVRTFTPYAPTGAGSQWTHVSPAIAAAEIEVIRRRGNAAASAPAHVVGYEFGWLSEPLELVLRSYSVAFVQLQKVCIAAERLSDQLPRRRPNLTSVRR